MARNKIEDLKDHLFAQLERLNDETFSEEQIKREVEKAKAIEGVAKQIIEVERLSIDRANTMIEAIDKGIIKDDSLIYMKDILRIESKT